MLTLRPVTPAARPPPLDAAQGGYIAEGYDAALDELRGLGGDGRRAMAALEARYRDQTGERNNQLMSIATAGLKNEDVVALANYITQMP